MGGLPSIKVVIIIEEGLQTWEQNLSILVYFLLESVLFSFRAYFFWNIFNFGLTSESDIGVVHSCTTGCFKSIIFFPYTTGTVWFDRLEQLAKFLKSMETRRVGLIWHSWPWNRLTTQWSIFLLHLSDLIMMLVHFITCKVPCIEDWAKMPLPSLVEKPGCCRFSTLHR